ncbi:MAG: hypothetical protein K2P80_10605 [Beijerinckiaceae bacterium]|nr:hypothetical protein [Beijerinckiaceae bacterium]
MTRISQPLTSDDEVDDEAAISRNTIQSMRWTTILVWFLRLSAILCMARGLTYWAELLGMFDVDLVDRPPLQQGAIVFFAAIYCFAAVGLWLAAAWGAVVWFIALLGETAYLFLEPGMKFDLAESVAGLGPLRSPGHVLVGLLMVAIYLTLFWLSSHEEK